ncbi:MAG: hypothetical protein K2G99_04790, partial [Desulfovibrio sp.]|nr:hypothetical protein [Desulfovibrio sp.]
MATKKTSGKAKAAPKASDAEGKKPRGRAAAPAAGKGAKAPKAPRAVNEAAAAHAEEKALPADEHLALTEEKSGPLPAVEGVTALVPEEQPAAPKAAPAESPKTAPKAEATPAAKAEAKPAATAKAAPAADKAGPRMPHGITPRPLMA